MKCIRLHWQSILSANFEFFILDSYTLIPESLIPLANCIGPLRQNPLQQYNWKNVCKNIYYLRYVELRIVEAFFKDELVTHWILWWDPSSIGLIAQPVCRTLAHQLLIRKRKAALQSFHSACRWRALGAHCNTTGWRDWWSTWWIIDDDAPVQLDGESKRSDYSNDQRTWR